VINVGYVVGYDVFFWQYMNKLNYEKAQCALLKSNQMIAFLEKTELKS